LDLRDREGFDPMGMLPCAARTLIALPVIGV
jgi:hypothetical protein